MSWPWSAKKGDLKGVRVKRPGWVKRHALPRGLSCVFQLNRGHDRWGKNRAKGPFQGEQIQETGEEALNSPPAQLSLPQQ